MTTFFSLEVLPAGEGDCLLIHWGPKRSVAVVDGGPAKTFESTLAPRLDQIRKNRKVDTLELDLVMVSHVDNDHIIGIRKLFQELRNDQNAARAENDRRFRVNRLWHNAFTDILGEKFDSYYTPKTTAALTAAVSQGAAKDLAEAGLGGIPDEDQYHLALVLAGHAEGRTLRDDYKLLFDAGRIQRLNMPFVQDGNPSPLMLTPSPTQTKISDLTLLVTGPSESELTKLRVDFEKFLVEKHLAVPAALVAAASEQDSSPTNLSSVVCLLEFAGKKILLTGDALGERILDGLHKAKLLERGPFHVDVLKVPHHGSARNVNKDFFKKVTADRYVFSADGKHGNPDRETLEWLVGSRGKKDEYEIVFTYPVKQIDEIRKKIHERKHQDWDADRHGLEALIGAYTAEGYAFSFSDGRKVIDLGTEKLTD
jgi:beta-lactamase superfamily II metal-dependent hydrolase